MAQPATPVRQRVPAGVPPSTEGNHLTLRVMRLSKPTYGVEPPILTEAGDVPTFSNDNFLPTNTSSNANRGFGQSDMFLLPKSFGTIYVGELFSSYINLINHTDQDVRNIRLKAELQTKSNEKEKDKEVVRVPLSSRSNLVEHLAPGGSTDYVVNRRVIEAGAHILVCAVTYEVGGEKKSFRKFFKFSVLDPFKLKHRISYIKKEVSVELQVTNATLLPLIVDKVEWVQSKFYNSVDLNGIYRQQASFSVTTALAPGGVRNYLFKLQPSGVKKTNKAAPSASSSSSLTSSRDLRTSEKKENNPLAASADLSASTSIESIEKDEVPNPEPDLESDDDNDSLIGYVDVFWTSGLGEKARRRISLPCKPIVEAPIDLELLDIPSIVHLEQPFSVVCKITNNSAKPIEPLFKPNEKEMIGVLFSGLSGMRLQEIPPGDSVQHPITLFPLYPGIQQILGIQLEDGKGRTIAKMDPVDVFVSPNF